MCTRHKGDFFRVAGVGGQSDGSVSLPVPFEPRGLSNAFSAAPELLRTPSAAISLRFAVVVEGRAWAAVFPIHAARAVT